MLSPRQAAFVAEYLVDLNATQAAIRAGYSAHTAEQQGPRLLGNAGVAAAIQAGQKARAERVEISQDRVLRELVDMALFDPADIARERVREPADIAKLPEHVRRAITGWSWDKAGNFVLRLSPKTPSLDMLARHLGIYEADNKQANGLDKLAEVLDARRNRVRGGGS